MSNVKLNRVEFLHAISAGNNGVGSTVHSKNVTRLEFDAEAEVIIIQAKPNGETVLIPLHGNVKQMVVAAEAPATSAKK